MSFLFALLLLSQQPANFVERETIVYAKKTIVDFEDGDLVEGDLMMPDVSYLETRKRIRFDSLIKIRQDFRMRVLRSINDLY